MKEGKIKDSCIVIAGQSPNGSAYNENAVGVEFHQGKKAFGDTYLQPSGVWTTEVTKLAEPLDILMSVRAPVGPTNITDRQICIGRGLAAIRCKEGILHKYVFYALKNIESRIVGNDGAVFNSINKTQIEDLPLPKISLSEQERIVSYLDAEFAKIDALKANIEQQLQASKDLFQSALKEMLTPKEGWMLKTLGELCEMRRGLTYSKHDEADKSSNIVLRSNNVDLESKKLDFTELKYLKEDFIIPDDKKVQAGSFLICMSNGSKKHLGKVALIDKNYGYAFGGFMGLLVPDKTIISEKYLWTVLSSQRYADYIKSLSDGAGINNLKYKDIAAFIIPTPNFETQQQIADLLDSLSAKIKALQENNNKALVLCNDLKQSLLKSIFE